MSTTVKIVLIVSSVLLVCLICAGIIIGTSFGRGGFGMLFGSLKGESFNVDESADLDLGGIDTINVHCVSGKIIVEEGDPHAALTGSVLSNNQKDSYLAVEKNGSTLTVKFDSNVVFPQTISSNVTLSVTLPKDVLANLNVTGASADAQITGLDLQDMRVDTASGRTNVSFCTGDTLHIGAASGRINVSDAQFSRIDAGSTSGTVSILDSAGDVSATCTSGNVETENITGSVKAGSTSGTVRVTNVTGDVDIKNTSGSAYVLQEQKEIGDIHVGLISGTVEVKLNSDAAFDLDIESTSGGFSTDFDETVSGSMSKKVVGEDLSGKVNGGGAQVDLSTVSGGIRVNKISK